MLKMYLSHLQMVANRVATTHMSSLRYEMLEKHSLLRESTNVVGSGSELVSSSKIIVTF